MEAIVIRGGLRLAGSLHVQGAKNAALPALAASLLAEGQTLLHNVPALDDVAVATRLLSALGAEVRRCGPSSLCTEVRGTSLQTTAPYRLVRRMRASFLVTGPLLGRRGAVRAALPGGCAIGHRPIDLHLRGFAAMGAEISLGHGVMDIRAPRLRGADIHLDYPSVTATENLMMAATQAAGLTRICNAAEEPEVVDLARFLISAGADIQGAGTRELHVRGTGPLRPAEHSIIPDRIEAGTYLLTAAATGGRLTLHGIEARLLGPLVSKLEESGCCLSAEADRVEIQGPERPTAVDIKTMPYPGFPTDLQAPFMASMARARGVSVITETVFENRFLHVDELRRMGAMIAVDGRSAVVTGISSLSGAPVTATDLRAGAALIIAGLSARGITRIHNPSHIDRGYSDMVGKLRSLGASIRRHT